MLSLDKTFEELREQLSHPELLNPARSDPFFYFVHAPAETVLLKQKTSVWSSALSHQGWKVERLSLAREIWKLVVASGRWEEWLALEPNCEVQELNEAISDVLSSDNALIESIAKHVCEEREKVIVLITDTAALHPYFRVRALESGLHNRVKVPTVVFYPGRRSGQYGLHFLDFYDFDGNYRATLLGGIE